MQLQSNKSGFANYQGDLEMQNKLSFFPEEDIMRFSISDEAEAASVELSPNITAELNKKGDISCRCN
jgi:hypothetical protein